MDNVTVDRLSTCGDLVLLMNLWVRYLLKLVDSNSHSPAWAKDSSHHSTRTTSEMPPKIRWAKPMFHDQKITNQRFWNSDSLNFDKCKAQLQGTLQVHPAGNHLVVVFWRFLFCQKYYFGIAMHIFWLPKNFVQTFSAIFAK